MGGKGSHGDRAAGVPLQPGTLWPRLSSPAGDSGPGARAMRHVAGQKAASHCSEFQDCSHPLSPLGRGPRVDVEVALWLSVGHSEPLVKTALRSADWGWSPGFPEGGKEGGGGRGRGREPLVLWQESLRA